MKRPLFSLVIPAYNEEDYIGSCLESLKNQDFPKENFEIIVVDNNSADKTGEISRRLGVKIVRENKQGLTYARMKGIKESQGKIIACIDADTTVKPNYLKEIEKIFNQDPQVVGIGVIAELQPKNLLVHLVQPISHLSLKIFKIMPGYNFSLKKSAYLKSGGYDPAINFNEDVFLSKQLKKVGKIIIVKNDLSTTSSRRFWSLGVFSSYVFKILFSFFTVSFFNRSFFVLKPIGRIKKKDSPT